MTLNSSFSRPGQATATFERNISQHCWVQHVARVWLPCCDAGVAICCDGLGIEIELVRMPRTQHHCKTLAKRLQRHATSTNVA